MLPTVEAVDGYSGERTPWRDAVEMYSNDRDALLLTFESVAQPSPAMSIFPLLPPSFRDTKSVSRRREVSVSDRTVDQPQLPAVS